MNKAQSVIDRLSCGGIEASALGAFVEAAGWLNADVRSWPLRLDCMTPTGDDKYWAWTLV